LCETVKDDDSEWTNVNIKEDCSVSISEGTSLLRHTYICCIVRPEINISLYS
jgi:hypothetical protein